MNGYCRNYARPCFTQADLLVRSLLSDPAVGYVPPFIVILTVRTDEGPPGRILFSHPSHFPPRSLIENWPKSCGSSGCHKIECGSFDLNASCSLSAGSAMVRESSWSRKRVVCNLWGCEVLHLPEEGMPLRRCQRCQEVLYCCRQHQVRMFFSDWSTLYVDMFLAVCVRLLIGDSTRLYASEILRICRSWCQASSIRKSSALIAKDTISLLVMFPNVRWTV